VDPILCGPVHVVFLALSQGRLATTAEDMDYVLARGGRVTLVVGDPQAWGQLDHRVDVIGLSSAEQRHWLLRAERFLLYGVSDMPLRVPQRVLDACAGRTPAPFGRRLTRTAKAIARGRGRVRRSANRLHNGLFVPPYRMVRPWVLWRVARRGLLSDHDFSGTDQIVVADVFATAVGWHLARRLPHVKVGFSLDRQPTRGQVAPPT
jgi:hypothetical protein